LREFVRTAGGADELLHFGSKITSTICIRLSFYNDVKGYALAFKIDSEDNLFPLTESMTALNPLSTTD